MDHIWSSETRLDAPTLRSSSPCDAGAELSRFAAVKSLRSVFARLVTQHGAGAKAPPLAFERWLARAALLRGTEPDGDPDDRRCVTALREDDSCASSGCSAGQKREKGFLLV